MELARDNQEIRFSELIKNAELRIISESEKEELKTLGSKLGVVRDTEVTGGVKRDCFYVCDNFLPCNPSTSTSSYCHRICI